ncbi:hypothetical protein, partial [Phaeodactylibacter luteus]|uniref:hypothetical protein n=1 Tax=Phaeodactylibacter luteus TaxID=1564516 RepID=UPI001B8721E8
MKVEISKKSYKNPHKKRNGDFCEFEIIENGNLVILALGDGVGSSPCDWKASKVCCQTFIEPNVQKILTARSRARKFCIFCAWTLRRYIKTS